MYAGGSTTARITVGVIGADPPSRLEPVSSPLMIPAPLLLVISASADDMIAAFLSRSRSLSRAINRMVGLSSKLRITIGGLSVALEFAVVVFLLGLGLVLRLMNTCFSFVRALSGGLEGGGVAPVLASRRSVSREKGRGEEATAASRCIFLRRRRRMKIKTPRTSATTPAATPPPIAATGVPEEVKVATGPTVSISVAEDETVFVLLHNTRRVSKALASIWLSLLTKAQAELSRCLAA